MKGKDGKMFVEYMCGLAGICSDCIGCSHSKPHQKETGCEYGCFSANAGKCVVLH